MSDMSLRERLADHGVSGDERDAAGVIDLIVEWLSANGLAIVPVEATKEMLANHLGVADEIYADMVKAAPPASVLLGVKRKAMSDEDERLVEVMAESKLIACGILRPGEWPTETKWGRRAWIKEGKAQLFALRAAGYEVVRAVDDPLPRVTFHLDETLPPDVIELRSGKNVVRAILRGPKVKL